jgi:nucleoside-diphosphate-sugar epimerase
MWQALFGSAMKGVWRERSRNPSTPSARNRSIHLATVFGVVLNCRLRRPYSAIDAEGRDSKVSRLALLIRKFGVLPLMGSGSGLRQPVHAEDLATGAIAAAASAAAIDKTYAVPGGETISYREMVGPIFDALGRPRRIISAPPMFWRAAFALARPFFPNANAAMGARRTKDMVFDGAPAIRDFGWNPRSFHPDFGGHGQPCKTDARPDAGAPAYVGATSAHSAMVVGRDASP